MGPCETQEKLSDQARRRAACRTGREYIKTGESKSSRPPLETEAGTGPAHAGVCGEGGPMQEHPRRWLRGGRQLSTLPGP